VSREDLNKNLCQEICDLVADKVPCTIGLADKSEKIFVSSDPALIGRIVVGARRITSGKTDGVSINPTENGGLEGACVPLRLGDGEILCLALFSVEQTAKTFAPVGQAYAQSLVEKNGPPDDEAVKASPLFKAFFQQSFQFSGLLSVDGRNLMSNDRALKFMGVSQEDIQGKIFWETQWIDLQIKGKVDKVKNAFFKACKGEPQRVELVQDRDDAGQLVSDLWFKPVFNHAGEVAYITAEVRDYGRYKAVAEELQQTQRLQEERIKARTADLEKQIKERQLAEDQLRESEERFKQIAEVASDWFWETDEQHRFTYISGRFFEISGINPSGVVGYSRKQFVGRQGIGKASDVWKRHFENLDARRPFYGFEYQLTTKEGEPFILQLSGVPVFDGKGQFKGYRGAGRDVTSQRRTEEAHKAAEERFRDIAETASDWFWEMGPDLRFSYISSRGFETMNISAMNILGKTRREVIEELGIDVEVPGWREHFEDLERHLPFNDFEYTVLDGDGKKRWLTISGKPFFGEDGEFQGYRGTARDITELRQREEALRESEARLGDYVETASDWVWEMDADLRFSYFSERIAEILGVPAEYTLGKRRQDVVHLADEDKTWQKHLEDLESRRPFRDFRYRYRHPDGKERYLSISGKPLFDNDGNFLGYRGTGTNITEEILQKRAVEESERRFRGLVENSSLGVVVHHNFEMLFVNETVAQMLGYQSAEEVRALGDARLLVAPDERERIENFGTERAAGRYVPTTYEFRLLKKDGSEIWVSNHAFMIEWDGLSCICATLFDVTSQKTASETLEKAKEAADTANRAKSDFLARMSHELRTPLNSIIGLSEMLLEEATENEDADYQEPLERINRSGDHLLLLINDILDISKIEAGRMELHLEEFNVATLVDQIRSTTVPLAEKNGNRLIVTCDSAVKKMQSDAVRVRQLLINLLSNACKFTENGEVRLDVRREQVEENASVYFEVYDTGIGIDAAKIPHLFEDFTQADPSTTRKYGGTGLGLAICRRLCSLMGGRITVTSELGEGALFTVQLPEWMEDTIQGEEAEGEEGGASFIASNGIILVVDGEHASRRDVARLLSGEGFDIFFAHSGLEGLEMVRELRPTIVLLDILLPDMDGWEVLNSIKSNQDTADIPVIITTIMSNKGQAFELGATDFLTKPVEKQRLISLTRDYAGKSRGQVVLIVDDEQDDRLVARSALEKSGFEVMEAENGRQGLDKMREKSPDIVILDLMMPKMDGFEFLAQIRGDSQWNSLPVLILTAMDLSLEEKHILNGRVQGLLQKGGEMGQSIRERLRQRVDEVLRVRNHAS